MNSSSRKLWRATFKFCKKIVCNIEKLSEWEGALTCISKGVMFTVGHKMWVNILGLAMVLLITDIVLKNLAYASSWGGAGRKTRKLPIREDFGGCERLMRLEKIRWRAGVWENKTEDLGEKPELRLGRNLQRKKTSFTWECEKGTLRWKNLGF